MNIPEKPGLTQPQVTCDLLDWCCKLYVCLKLMKSVTLSSPGEVLYLEGSAVTLLSVTQLDARFRLGRNTWCSA